MRHTHYAIFGIFTLVLFGFGCSNTADKSTSSTTTPAVIKPPNAYQVAQEQALKPTRSELVCESRSFTVVDRFDSKQNNTVQYCQFSDGSECELQSYIQGICGPGQGAAILTNPNLLLNKYVELTCEEHDPPVCGKNGHSYLNECIAIQTGIPIAHKGICTKAEIDAHAPEREQIASERETIITKAKDVVEKNRKTNADRETPPPATSDPLVATQGNRPEWISTSISLIEAGAPTAPRTYMNSCTLKDTRVYIETNGTDTVPSTLYSKDGEIICNPNRDFAALCPDNLRLLSCTRIYTDGR